jgi:ribosomal protein S20
MHNKRTILIFVTGALAVVLTLGTVAYRSVFAATPDATSTGATTTQTNPGRGVGKGPAGGYNNEDLATALGVSVDILNTAYQTAYKAALDQAVTQGLITQTQADQLISSGKTFPIGGRGEEYLSKYGIDFNTYLANALNITVDQLKAAYQTATFARIDQAVTNGQLTQEQSDLMKGKYTLFNDSTFQSSMQSAFTSAVNQAVTSGVITQSQANQILSNNGNMFKFNAGGFGGPGGHHGHGGEGFPGDIPLQAP